MNANVLWIDDEIDSYMPVFPAFRQAGLDCTPSCSFEEAADILKSGSKKFSLILLDLLMAGIDGIDAYRRIRNSFPDIPIAFFTNFSHEEYWKNRINQLDEHVQVFDKHIPITLSPAFQELTDRLITLAVSPFDIELEEYRSLNSENRSDINAKAYALTRPVARNYFHEHPDVDWLAVQGTQNNIVYTGAGSIGDDEQLVQLEQSEGKPVFVIARPRHIIEETWSYREITDDHYPNILMSFGPHEGNNASPVISFDFDTGSTGNFIDSCILSELGSSNHHTTNHREQTSEIWGKAYSYVDVKIDVSVPAPFECYISGTLECQAVLNWHNTPFTRYYKERKGLVGRRFLSQNKLRIILDAKLRTSFLCMDPSCEGATK